MTVSGGSSYVGTDGTLTFTAQYNEVKYALPTTLNISDYSGMIVVVNGTASDAFAVKLRDSSDTELAVWYGKTETTTLDLSGKSGEAAMICIMAGNGACTVQPVSVVFIKK